MQQLDVTPEELFAAGLDWKDLERIENHYQSIRPALDAVGRFMVDQMIGTKSIHSLNYRLKDPEHLLVKIIRKKLENPGRILTGKKLPTWWVCVHCTCLKRIGWVFIPIYEKIGIW